MSHSTSQGRAAIRPSVLLGLFLLAVLPVLQADQWLMKMDDVPGQWTTGRFAGWTPVESVEGLVSRPGSGTNAVLACTIRKDLDRLSPRLLMSCHDGQPVRRVSLALVSTQSDVVRYRLTLDGVLFETLTQELQPDAAREVVTLSASRIEWAQFELDPTGGISGGLTGVYDQASDSGALKLRLPFRAGLSRDSGGLGIALTCPVESGHRYRILARSSLDAPWETWREFTATADGMASHFLPTDHPALFFGVEEVD